MKAYKQINLSFEKRIVFSYAALLCFVCSFIVLSPVFAQESDEKTKNDPDVQIDVNKEYDEHGNVIGYDSTYTWCWHGNNFSKFHDSVYGHFKNCFPPHVWHFKDMDSSLYSYFDDDWFKKFNFEPPHIPNFHHFDIPFHDSLGISFHNFHDMHKFFEDEFDIGQYLPDENYFEQFQEKHSEFMERFNDYQKEHQKLLEKYFKQPYQKGDNEPEAEPNKYSPDNNKSEEGKSGKV